jgi:hypothetical protein
MIRPYLILGLVVAFVAAASVAGWQGYRMGYAKAQAAHDADLLAQIEAGQKLEADRRRVARERDALAEQLERAGNAEPVIVERCLAPSRVRRLNTLR